MNDDATIRAIIAGECDYGPPEPPEQIADRIIAALAFHNFQIVPSPLEDWRRTQFKPLPTPPGWAPNLNSPLLANDAERNKP